MVSFEITCTSHHVLTPRVNQQTKTIIIFIIIDRLWSFYTTMHDYSRGSMKSKRLIEDKLEMVRSVWWFRTPWSLFLWFRFKLSIAISLVIIITALLCYLLVSHGISRSSPLWVLLEKRKIWFLIVIIKGIVKIYWSEVTDHDLFLEMRHFSREQQSIAPEILIYVKLTCLDVRVSSFTNKVCLR